MYDVDPPESTPSPTPPPLAAIEGDRPCLRCGYNLHGLKPDARCPECGAPVRHSLQGNLLIFSAPEYLASLHRGTILILVAVILQIVVFFAMIAGMFIAEFMHTESAFAIQLIIHAFYSAFGVLSLVGWWLFSEPDRAILGASTGDTPRQVLRTTVVILALATIADLIATIGADEVIQFAGSLVSWVAGVVSFFASLLYIRWLAPRLPSAKIADRAQSYLWLLPLIYIVGACLIVGPLVAAVMYFLFINEIRLRLREIREGQARSVDPEMATA